MSNRVDYYRRTFDAYVLGKRSHLSFWHETPALNEGAPTDRLGSYYMTFREKADYGGPFDEAGVPLLDYRGSIGPRYNPIAIAQYGLGNLNVLLDGDRDREGGVRAAADWLANRLSPNAHGVPVWMHDFDWVYRSTLHAPWYSGLAQGQGLSLLLRAEETLADPRYGAAAERALESLMKPLHEGGVLFEDARGRLWIEEYIVSPPTHILNGFMWGMWGLHDYAVARQDAAVQALFDRCVETLSDALGEFDTGFWSLYEQSGTRLKMYASPFYHSLHIVQLHVMQRLTGRTEFSARAARWERYQASALRRRTALALKVLFKVVHY